MVQIASLRDKDVGGLRNEIGTVRDKIEDVRKQVDSLMVARVFNPAIQPPLSPKEVKRAADNAFDQKITIRPDLIQDVSQPLFRNVTDEKWDAITSLLKLRSFVNSTLEHAQQNIVQTIVADPNIQYAPILPRGPGQWLQSVGGNAKLDAADKVEPGMFNGGGQPLKVLSNIIFRDVTVIYRGGDVRLVNVFFVNCTFDLPRSDKGVIVAQALLKPEPYVSLTN
jgi:hypothetical protein